MKVGIIFWADGLNHRYLSHGHWWYIPSSKVFLGISLPACWSHQVASARTTRSGPVSQDRAVARRSKRCLWLGLKWLRPWLDAAICFKSLRSCQTFHLVWVFRSTCLWKHLWNVLVWSVYGILMLQLGNRCLYMIIYVCSAFVYHLILYTYMFLNI